MLSVCKEYQSDIMDGRSNCAVSLLGVYRSADIMDGGANHGDGLWRVLVIYNSW